MEISSLQKARYEYAPKLPGMLSLKLSSSLLPPGRLPSISESGWDETGCASVPSMQTKTQV